MAAGASASTDQLQPDSSRSRGGSAADTGAVTAESARAAARNRALRRALRVAIVLPATLGGLLYLKQPSAAFMAAFAVICMLVLADYSGPRRERASSIAISGLAGGAALILGAVTQFSPPLSIVMALMVGFAVSLLGVLRGFLARASAPILLPFFLAATTAHVMDTAVKMLAGWLFGCAVSLVAAIVFWPYFPRARLTEAIQRAMRSESAAVAALWADPPTGKVSDDKVQEVGKALGSLEHLYSGQLRRPGSAYRRERTSLRLIEEVRRIRLGLRSLWRQGVDASFPADRQLAAATASSLAQAADNLPHSTPGLGAFEDLQTARNAHWDDVEGDTRDLLATGDAQTLLRRVPAAFAARVCSMLSIGAVRDAALANAPPSTPVPPLMFRNHVVPSVIGVLTPWGQITAELNPRAPWFRNALRVGLALAVALLVVDITGVERGYWVVLATMSVLRLDRQSTRHNARDVFLGQLLGFAVGGLLLALLHTWPDLTWFTLPVFVGLLGYATDTFKTIYVQAIFTVTLMNMLAIVAPTGRGFPELRLLDATLGLIVAVVVSLLVMPRGLVPQVEASINRATRDSAAYLKVAIRRLGGALVGADVELLRHCEDEAVAARNSIELADQTSDLAFAQGLPPGAQTITWARAVSITSHVAYVAEAINMQIFDYPGGAGMKRVVGDLVVAADSVADRMTRNVGRVLSAVEDLPNTAELPDPPDHLTRSPEILALKAALEAEVTRWAAARATEMTATTNRLYWTYMWLAELDMLASALGAVATAVTQTTRATVTA